MKFLLVSLASLSIAGGGLAPAIANINKNENKINLQQETNEKFASTTISLGERVKLSTDQDHPDKTYEVTFDWNSNWGSIKEIQFHGGGLDSYSGWGGWKDWDVHENWGSLAVNDDGRGYIIQNDWQHDVVAKKEVWLSYSLANYGNECTLKFDFFTESFNSLTGAWGNLIIGDQLTFIS